MSSDRFFSDDEVKNKNVDRPWMKSDTARMLNLYCAGSATPDRIAQEMGRTPKAVKRQLELFTYNERDRAVRYEPQRRVSRKGQRFSKNEQVMWDKHRELGVPAEVTAKVFCRPIKELDGSQTERKVKVAKTKAGTMTDRMECGIGIPSIDLIWAYRYIYFVWNKEKEGIISDQLYDDLVQEECEYKNAQQFEEIKRHQGWPEHIRSLAMYLAIKHERDNQEGQKKK